MAMGILSALKLQEGSIQELAKLPQPQLVKMAQDGRINVNLLPVLINEKAQMAQAAASAQAMAAQPKPSIMEQNMMVNAQAEAAQPRQSGIANLPMDERTFTGAAGGIVAFEGGGRATSNPYAVDFKSLPTFQDAAVPGNEMMSYFGGGRATSNPYAVDFKSLPTFQDAAVPGNEMMSYFGSVGADNYRRDPITGERISLGDFLRRKEAYEIQLAKQGVAAQGQVTGLPSKDEMRAAAEATRASMTPGGRYDLERGRADSGINMQDVINYAQQQGGKGQAAPTAPAAGMDLGLGKERSDITAAYKGITDELAAARGKKPTVEGAIAETAEFDKAFGVDRDYYKKQADEIAKQKEGLKLDRAEAGNMRLIEAGLAIMGGESPYAFVNIGKGASKAMAGFAEDIKDIKKQSREFDKARREVEAAAQTAARTDSAKAQERYQHKMDKYQSVGVELAKTKAGLAERLADIGYKEKSLKVQEKSIKPSQFSEMYDKYAADEVAAGRKPSFEKFRKAYGSQDESSEINRTRYALTAINDLLLGMKKDNPEYAGLMAKRKALLERLSGSATTGVSSGGAKFVGYE